MSCSGPRKHPAYPAFGDYNLPDSLNLAKQAYFISANDASINISLSGSIALRVMLMWGFLLDSLLL